MCGLFVATYSLVMANDYIVPMQASASVVNIFHRVGATDTLAKDYFVKLSSSLTPEIYELRRCPNNRTTCPGKELERQSFWRNAGLSNDLNHIFIDVVTNPKYVFYSEKVYDDKGKVVDYYRQQCTAFAKMLDRNSSGTSKWHRGNHVQSSLNGVSYEQAIARDRGKIIMYFGDRSIYPSGKQTPYGHVGMIVDYIYTNGKPVGLWMVDANFLGTGDRPDGRITKHVLMFSNGKSGSLNASNYHFMKR